jgi:hypothetical protein
MKRAVVFASSFLVIVACSSTTAGTNEPAGTSCTTDAECNSGSCLDLPVVTGDGGCTSAGKACSTRCAFDTDCAVLGAKFKCFGGCGTTMVCGATP